MGGITQYIDSYGYFTECDIETPKELHDKFNDLPFFPQQKVGMYSDGIKKYAEKNDMMDKVKDRIHQSWFVILYLVKNI